MSKTIPVTGAGMGFGRLASEILARAGHRLRHHARHRRPQRRQRRADRHPRQGREGRRRRARRTIPYENTRHGIDSVIVQPGAQTDGPNHVGGARHAADEGVAAQYHRINDLPPELAGRLASLAQPGRRADPAERSPRDRFTVAGEGRPARRLAPAASIAP